MRHFCCNASSWIAIVMNDCWCWCEYIVISLTSIDDVDSTLAITVRFADVVPDTCRNDDWDCPFRVATLSLLSQRPNSLTCSPDPRIILDLSWLLVIRRRPCGWTSCLWSFFSSQHCLFYRLFRVAVDSIKSQTSTPCIHHTIRSLRSFVAVELIENCDCLRLSACSVNDLYNGFD